MKKVGVVGAGHSVPERVLTNADLEKMVDTSDEWIRTRTGIRERRIAAKGEGTSDHAARAAAKALQHAGIGPEEVDLIICATSTPDMPLPSAACLVQKKIGAKNAAAFDLAAACAGFIYGVVTGEQFVRSGLYRTVVVIGADQLSSYVDWKDRSTCVLFGDGAGAVVLREVERGGILSSVLGADGSYVDLLNIPDGGSLRPPSAATVSGNGHFIHMSGTEVFKLAVRWMIQAVKDALSKAGVRPEEVSCFIPHQANQRIIDAVAQRLQFRPEALVVNLDRYGNTSAASCIIAFCEALEQGRVAKGDKVVFSTFGSGLVWASLVMEW